MKVWIVGECYDAPNAWDFVGVFQTEELAVKACTTMRHFVGPAEMDYRTPDEPAEWVGSYFPIKEPQ